jgi:amino acid transporter
VVAAVWACSRWNWFAWESVSMFVSSSLHLFGTTVALKIEHISHQIRPSLDFRVERF